VCGYRFHVEHVLPSARGGPDALANRALACASCNLAKSDRMRALDPVTDEEVPLFNPRKQEWAEHFRWSEDGMSVVGLSACGRATMAALDLNGGLRREARQLWFATGWLP
jgi:5-methylcytosine-specific restriction endonuclease McrA